ncbi:MAG TPA: inositol monophosphatase [Phycisphaerae bacterium]|nr:inositol monophosphatase [Phycisphaerae bacterium]
MDREYDQIRRDALPWVRRAGLIARRMFGSAVASRKEDRSPVTEADLSVQEALLAEIARRYPADAVVTEETQRDPRRHAALASAKRCWVIDPIDGTRNYARSVPIYSVSVAVMEAGRPVVGIVFDPTTGDLFSAGRGGGLWLGDQRVPARTGESAYGMLIGSPAGQQHCLPGAAHHWLDKYHLCNLGSTTLHVAYVAAGGFDAAMVTECHLWDIAAACLMTDEAGVITKRLDGSPVFPIHMPDQAYDEVSFFAAWPAVWDKLWSDLQTIPRPQ